MGCESENYHEFQVAGTQHLPLGNAELHVFLLSRTFWLLGWWAQPSHSHCTSPSPPLPPIHPGEALGSDCSVRSQLPFQESHCQMQADSIADLQRPPACHLLMAVPWSERFAPHLYSPVGWALELSPSTLLVYSLSEVSAA